MQPVMRHRFLVEFNRSDVSNHIPYTIGHFLQAFHDPMTTVKKVGKVERQTSKTRHPVHGSYMRLLFER